MLLQADEGNKKPLPPPASTQVTQSTEVGGIQSYLGRSKRLQQYNEMFPEELCNESQEKKCALVRSYLDG